MVTVSNMLKRWQRINVEDIAEEAVSETVGKLLEFNLEQLLEGKRKDGQDITPSYLEDPYFKSRESAQRYSDWKDRITPNAKRKKGVPNLFINGRFHESIEVRVTNRAINFSSSAPEASSIESKFREIYGLNAEKKIQYIAEFLRPSYMEIVRSKLKSG